MCPDIRLFSLSLEKLDLWLKVISSVLAGLTVMVGIGAFITGQKLSDKQAKQIATANAEAAKANLRTEELAKQNNDLRTSMFREGWRRKRIEDALQARKFAGDLRELERFEGTEVEIIALNKEEPKDFSKQIRKALVEARWKVMYLEVDDLSRFMTDGGVTIEIGISPDDVNPLGGNSPTHHAAKALDEAFQKGKLLPAVWTSRQLASTRLRVIIGPKSEYRNMRREVEERMREAGQPLPPEP